MTAEKLFQMIKELENGERWKLLDMMYDEYYNVRSNPNMEERLSNIEKDVEFLSGKIGIHDMYFNRIHKEEGDRA
ncbi:hypothetical protein [Peribacillus frigoritolerans]|uniref:hypothetical protein n=1 Tax=Peribacillus frigoritolerans TaxID=450367 RepID=UPI00105A4357|nr:hypothetical protein [Peribacillus frigoritolerans]TDL80968.1 hypothetical protein E2R53_13420 [Peribacillus frigoritolerans]